MRKLLMALSISVMALFTPIQSYANTQSNSLKNVPGIVLRGQQVCGSNGLCTDEPREDTPVTIMGRWPGNPEHVDIMFKGERRWVVYDSALRVIVNGCRVTVPDFEAGKLPSHSCN